MFWCLWCLWRKSAAVLKAAQRLHAENYKLAYLVGLIEGDGWFSFSKNGKYLMYKVGIELHVRDWNLLYQMQHLLGGIGNIIPFHFNTYKNNKCRFNIINKQCLIHIIFPVFDKYPMLSNNSITYFRFKSLLLANVIYYEEAKVHLESCEFKHAFSVQYLVKHRLNGVINLKCKIGLTT